MGVDRATLRALWILQTGAAGHILPDEFPSPATCWRRLKQWEDEGIWLDAWRALLGALDGEGLLKWDEAFLDGSFAPTKKGAPQSVKPSAARVRSGWYWSTVKVFRWEVGSKVPLRVKLRLRKPRSPKCTSRGREGVRGRTQAHNRRPGIRLRSAARTHEEARHRFHRALPEKQQTGADTRTAQTAALRAPLDSGANQRLAWSIPPTAGAT